MELGAQTIRRDKQCQGNFPLAVLHEFTIAIPASLVLLFNIEAIGCKNCIGVIY